MTKRTSKKQWQPGDLVLLETGPKVHNRLMEIVEINGPRAKLAILDLTKPPNAVHLSKVELWAALEELVDPALYIKTEEFLETLRAHLVRHEAVNA